MNNNFGLIKAEIEKVAVVSKAKTAVASVKSYDFLPILKKVVKGLVYSIAALIYAVKVFSLVVIDLFILLGLLVEKLYELKETALDALADVIVKAIEAYKAVADKVKAETPIIVGKVKGITVKAIETTKKAAKKATEIVTEIKLTLNIVNIATGLYASLTVATIATKAKKLVALTKENISKALTFREEILAEDKEDKE